MWPMTKPFDAAMREVFAIVPPAWMEFFGIPVPDPDLVESLDTNLSTVTAEADQLIRRGGPDPLILHIEFVSGRDLSVPRRVHWYNTLAERKYEAPVWSVLFLLRPSADGPDLTGEYVREFPGRGPNLAFRYDVLRVWELPPERLLTGGLPLLTLAPVSNVAPAQLPEVLTAVARRLRDEAGPELAKTLWTATAILTTLRYPREQVSELIEDIAMKFLEIPGIEESWLYQDILTKGRGEGRAEGRAEGEAEEARKILLRQGRKRLGEPDPRVASAIAGIANLDRLDGLLDRILDVSSWDELLPPGVPTEEGPRGD